MKEKPILFNGEMVGATLDDRKNQTRRVVKDQPGNVGGCYHRPDGLWIWTHLPVGKGVGVGLPFKCPYGQPGDELWVREPFMVWLNTINICGITPIDKAINLWSNGNEEYFGNKERWIRKILEKTISDEHGDKSKMMPSIHMPRWASRIQLKIKDIRVERVQDISEEDAKLEGIESSHDGTHIWFKNYLSVGPANFKYTSGSIKSFESLWNSINEKRGFGWTSNPWIWKIEFELINNQST